MTLQNKIATKLHAATTTLALLTEVSRVSLPRPLQLPGLGFNVPIMCLIDASSRVATNHHNDLDLFTSLFSNRMLLDK